MQPQVSCELPSLPVPQTMKAAALKRNEAFSRRIRAATAKKCTKKRDARAELLVYLYYHIRNFCNLTGLE